jgi:hypothetical protein
MNAKLTMDTPSGEPVQVAKLEDPHVEVDAAILEEQWIADQIGGVLRSIGAVECPLSERLGHYRTRGSVDEVGDIESRAWYGVKDVDVPPQWRKAAVPIEHVTQKVGWGLLDPRVPKGEYRL